MSTHRMRGFITLTTLVVATLVHGGMITKPFDYEYTAMQHFFIGRSNQDSEVCTTRACKDYADLLLASIDKTVDPCHDFYKYSCGKYIASHKLPEGVNSQGTLNLISASVNAFLSGKNQNF